MLYVAFRGFRTSIFPSATMAPAPSSPSLCRALSYSEENWTKSATNGTGIVAFGAALKRDLDISHIVKAVHDISEQHTILKAKIAQNAHGKFVFEVGDTPVVKEKPWPSQSSQDAELSHLAFFDRDYDDRSLSIGLHKIVKEELNLPFLNGEGQPSTPIDVFQICVYKDSKKPQTVIVLRFIGSGIDRYGSSAAIQDFLAALNCHVKGKQPDFAENPGKNTLLPSLEDLIPKGIASKGFLQKGVDAIGYAWHAKKYSLLPLNPAFATLRKEPFQSDLMSLSLGKHGTSSLLAACRKEGISPASALSAAFLKAAVGVKEMKGNEFSFTSVLDCRGYFDPPLPKRTVGSYTGALLMGEKVKDSVSFWDLARHISTSFETSVAKSKHFSELPVLGLLFSQVLKHPNLTPSSSLRSALFSIFADDLLNTQWQNVDALQLVGALGPFSSMHFVGPCFAVGESLVEGDELLLSFIFPTPVYTRQQMDSYFTSALEVLSSATKSY